LLEGPLPDRSRFASIQPLMEHVRDNDAAYLTRSRELAFLANTLMAGCSVQSRSFTPHEASEAAVGICNLGLEHWPARWRHVEPRASAAARDRGGEMPATFLVDHDLVSAFEVGWTVLHQDVCMFAAEQLIATLRDRRQVEKDIQRGLDALRRELLKQRRAGTPWRARGALDALAMLDVLENPEQMAADWNAVLRDTDRAATGVLDPQQVPAWSMARTIERRVLWPWLPID
jgi:hypothetical protein